MYHKHLYLNKDIDCLISNSIKEFDIKSAGFNILMSSGAFTEEQIIKLNALPKYERNVKIGLMKKKNKELTKIENEGLIKYRKQFIEMNKIPDSAILSIKKDAIFIVNHPIKYTTFDNITFVMKNRYSSYYYLNNIEFYYNSNTVDTKGLGDEVPIIHKKYMMKFLTKVFKQAESTSANAVRDRLYEFSDKYRNYELDPEYYRELNADSLFRLKAKLTQYLDYGMIGCPNNIKDIDISYNYMRYILPLIRIFY